MVGPVNGASNVAKPKPASQTTKPASTETGAKTGNTATTKDAAPVEKHAPIGMDADDTNVQRKRPDSSFEGTAVNSQRLMALKTNDDPKTTTPVRSDLAAQVSGARVMAHASSKSAKAAKSEKTELPKFMKSKDPDVNAAILTIEQRKHTSTNVGGWVQDEMLKLSPEQRKDLWANLPKDVKVRVERELYEGSPLHGVVQVARLENMSVADRQSALATMHQDQLDNVKAVSRAGEVSDPQLQISIGIELAARTSWGGDNGAVIDHLKQLQADGKITVQAGEGQAATSKDGSIVVDPDLLQSPEASAAILAHEGVHSKETKAHGAFRETMVEEVEGNMASTRVWAEIGDKNDPKLDGKKKDTLNEYADQYAKFGEAGVRARVAAEYGNRAGEWYEKNNARANRSSDPDKKQKALDDAAHHRREFMGIIDHIGSDKDAQKAMNKGYANYLIDAFWKMKPSEAEVTKLGAAFKHVPADLKKEILADMKKAMTADVYALFVKGVNG